MAAGSRFDFFIPSSDGKRRIHGIHWAPAGRTGAVIQIAHGMIEHIGRYREFASAMNDAGIAVIGHDHPGHGLTAEPGKMGRFACRGGAECVLEDLRRISDYAECLYPDTFHVLLGHSMGSFFVRRFQAVYMGKGADGIILLGTGSPPRFFLETACRLVRRDIRKWGPDADSARLHRLALRIFNGPFEKNLTMYQWLSRMTDENRKFEEDPLCRFYFSNSSLYEFLSVMLKLECREGFDAIPTGQPVLIMSGTEDPVGERGIGVDRVFSSYCDLGFEDVEMKLYTGARHELLHEQNREEIFADIRDWILFRASKHRK